MVTPVPTYEKFEVLYKKAMSGKETDFGDVTSVRVGDSVSYVDANTARASGLVEKVNSKARRLRVAAQHYQQFVLRPGRTLDFDAILEVLRPREAPSVEA